jgi:hypothetical protein
MTRVVDVDRHAVADATVLRHRVALIVQSVAADFELCVEYAAAEACGGLLRCHTAPVVTLGTIGVVRASFRADGATHAHRDTVARSALRARLTRFSRGVHRTHVGRVEDSAVAHDPG